MRTMQIQIPPPVTVLGIELNYQAFIRHLCDTDDRFTRNAIGIRTAVRIEQAIMVSPSGPIHRLEEGDWSLLTQVAEAPTGGYPELEHRAKDGTLIKRHQVGRHCIDFIDAIGAAVPVAQNGQSVQTSEDRPRERGPSHPET